MDLAKTSIVQRAWKHEQRPDLHGWVYGLKDGLINPISDGFFGTMTAGQEVYSFLGLAGANKSNNFTNWSAEDNEYVGITVTGFNIHVYAINADLGPKGLINVSLVQKVPKGTYVVAYGEANGQFYSVPFTEAGLKVSY